MSPTATRRWWRDFRRRSGDLGKTNLSEWANIRSNNSISGWSAVGGQARPLCARPQSVRIVERSGAAVAAGLVRMAIDRDRWLGYLPGGDQRHCRLEADRGLVSRTHTSDQRQLDTAVNDRDRAEAPSC
jgi:hypothetical protein